MRAMMSRGTLFSVEFAAAQNDSGVFFMGK